MSRKISEEEKLIKITKDTAGIRDAYNLAEAKKAARRKKWRDNNPEKAKKCAENFRANNADHIKTYYKEYYKKNKVTATEKHKAYMSSSKGEIIKAKRYLKYVEEKIKLDVKRTKWKKPLNEKRIQECKKILEII